MTSQKDVALVKLAVETGGNDNVNSSSFISAIELKYCPLIHRPSVIAEGHVRNLSETSGNAVLRYSYLSRPLSRTRSGSRIRPLALAQKRAVVKLFQSFSWSMIISTLCFSKLS